MSTAVAPPVEASVQVAEKTIDPRPASPSWRWPVVLMLVATAAAWVPLYLQRRSAHEPNVDDYLYTIVARQIADAGSLSGFVHAVLHTGQTAPLVVLLAAPGALYGVDGAVLVELPLLLLLAGAAWLLARRWVDPWAAALIGLAAAANQAVLGWSLMVHFSVAASAFSLLALASYLWSDGFRSWRWSALTGASVGLLLLSRSLAPVYVAAFAIAVGIDLLRRRRFGPGQMGLAVLIVAALAGPWWFVSGGTAYHYLTSAGYERSSGFTRSGAHLGLSSIVDRTRWTVGDLGTVQTIFLLAAPLIALTRIRRMPGALVVSIWLVLTLVALATSSNIGTGFGLPILAVAITLGGSLLLAPSHPATPRTEPDPSGNGSGVQSPSAGRRDAFLTGVLLGVAALVLLLVGLAVDAPGSGVNWALVASAAILAGTFMRFRPTAVVGLIVVLAVGFAAEWSGGRSLSWLGPPYRKMALQAANGASIPSIDAIHQDVARAIAGHPTLLIRDDDLLNGNGLRYAAMVGRLPQSLISAPFGDAAAGLQELRTTTSITGSGGLNDPTYQIPGTTSGNAEYLIAGASPAPYHYYGALAETAAARSGWQKIGAWTPACGNTIDLWRKVPGRSHRAAARKPRRSPYETTVLSDQPVGFWRLNDKICNAEDATGNYNLGAYLGKPAFGAPPLIAGERTSVHFDGKHDQVTLPHIAALDSAHAVTLEAWVRPDDVPTSANSGWQLVSVWQTALLYIRGGAKPAFVLAPYNAANASYTPLVVSQTRVVPHKTYHVVGTVDGSRMRLFVNGSIESSLADTRAVSHAQFGPVIDATGWGTLPSPHFRGTIGEVAIYAHALAAKRVRAHYRAGAGRSKR